jgi:hypothetical protein
MSVAGPRVELLSLALRLSPLSPVLGETDAPAPVRAKEWEGEGCSQRVMPLGGLETLTLILSPWPRGEAKQSRWD